MKKIILFFTIALFTIAYSCDSNNEPTPINYEVGDIGPAGGFVFYDSGNYDNGWRYIEAAPNDMEGFEWGCFNSPITNARNIDIGTGLENSIAILDFHNEFNNYYENPEQCSSSSNGTVAAKACLELVIQGFDNWHLPSEGEMLLMYENLHLNGLGNFDLDDKLYWSSTEYDDNTATVTDFSNGDQGWNCKQCDFGFTKVRAVRYF